MNDEDKAVIRNLYLNMSIRQIQENYLPHLTINAIKSYAKRSGLRKREKMKQQSKLKNKDIFEKDFPVSEHLYFLTKVKP